MQKRYLNNLIQDDLKRKMVWIGGPRQVGKTMLSKTIAKSYNNSTYLNWDDSEDRHTIQKRQWPLDTDLVIFDELHKYPRWKGWLKGIYDTKPEGQQYLVTGSARMDVYQRGGDSMVGRYHYWRLHPFTLDEWPNNIRKSDAVDRLLALGGFPEPLLEGDIQQAKRWRRERFQRILLEDIREMAVVQQIQLIDLFNDALKERVGSPIVLSNLARDLQVAHQTCARYLSLMESSYLAFSVYPLTQNIARAIQKPPKVYFYDNADVANGDGAAFENLVATHLLKRLHYLTDCKGAKTALHYIRDKDGREVDFVTIVNDEVYELIEVKTSDNTISQSLRYYHKKLKPKKTTQIVRYLRKTYDSEDRIRVTSAETYFANPPWPETSNDDLMI